jgi:hypothetical protein
MSDPNLGVRQAHVKICVSEYCSFLLQDKGVGGCSSVGSDIVA